MYQLKLVLIASIIALSGCVQSYSKPLANGSWNPPPQFSGEYTGELTVTRMPQDEVVGLCAAMFEEYGIAATATENQKGCAAITATGCSVVIIDAPFMGSTPEMVEIHEYGHCLGWPADHGGA